jgi:hypothetical protein
MDIKPIETVYNGYKFRSRLEARWAVFFDNAGIKYEYEIDGFDCGDAGWYLPDFYLPNVWYHRHEGVFIEVKHPFLNHTDYKKIERFGSKYPILLVTTIPINTPDYGQIFCQNHWDNGHIISRCPICDKFQIGFEGRLRSCKCFVNYGKEGMEQADTFEESYEKAKRHRF